MRVLDPGHFYSLTNLDTTDAGQPLTFVKREGENYPGNTSHYPGTTIQEVLRACIDRVKYLNSQIPDRNNSEVLDNLRLAIFHLEKRAASRHNRIAPPTDLIPVIEYAPVCQNCLHIGCAGECKH